MPGSTPPQRAELRPEVRERAAAATAAVTTRAHLYRDSAL